MAPLYRLIPRQDTVRRLYNGALRHRRSVSGTGASRAENESSVSTPDRSERNHNAGQAKGDDDPGLLSADTVSGISPHELAKLRTVYGFVRSHVDAMQKKRPAVDPEVNPLIDPRSFALRELPRVPDEALRQLRKELPSEQASSAKVLPSRASWDLATSAAPPQPGLEPNNDHDLAKLDPMTENLWASVDQRTMDPFYYARMSRQRVQRGSGPSAESPLAGGTSVAQSLSSGQGMRYRQRRNRGCRLRSAREKVYIDFRELGILSSFLNDHGKVMMRRKSGLSAKAQRRVAKSIKTARHMALLCPEPRPGLTLAEMREIEEQENALLESGAA